VPKLALTSSECQTRVGEDQPVDLDAFRWLLTDPGRELLLRARALLVGGTPALKVGERLRASYDGEQVATALGQLDLRSRAAVKFGADAELMFFTPDGLEQATRATVSAHRAARMAVAEPTSLIDLGCGIGGDLLAFSRAGLTCAGIDLDPVRVAVAHANLEALGLPGAVQVADATTIDTRRFDALFADPARRTGAGRSFDPDAWTPPWSYVEQWLTGPACVKVAPGIPHALVPDGVEAEWVSDRGEVKEAALWSGPLASARRRATVIGDGGLATLTEEDDPGAGVRPVGGFLYEPDGAVIRAGLVTAVAAVVGGGLLDPKIAYVTSDDSFHTPFARGYRVLEELPYREKSLKAALRERGIGSLTIKKRGVDVVPEELRKRLALAGDRTATLVLTRVAETSRSRGTALLVEPL
jgi:SAM-dependent methyltransferase